ncbi:tetratricopeptide repeat protein [Candidatus Magnetomonas plexicatena]|uniref:tetratricopeptide repeat protein n=1 Tax=Candidatus Magnetomonas plexicatena TaxID=2552947 RepID=UPI001C76A77A|nr:tetratricopeptide repeat protein [Nitrospirales bacterium LBB_01]
MFFHDSLAGTSVQNRSNKLSLILLIVVAVLAAYFPLRENGFINCDDPQYVTENSYVLEGLTWEGFKWAFKTNFFFNYHPLTWLAHMSDVQMFALNPAGHHMTSLIMHVLNTLLLLWFLRKMPIGLYQSLFVTALFALHPINVETVAWVSEKKNLLYTVFWFPSLVAYINYGKYKKKKDYFLCLIFFILSLLSKPMAVTLPFVLLLLDFWPLRRLSILTILEKIPFFILSFSESFITFNLHTHGAAISSLNAFPLSFRIGYSLVSYVNYIINTIYPVNLVLFYPYPENSLIMKFILSSVLLLLVTLFAVRLRKTHPYFLFSWAWYLGLLLPVMRFFFSGRDPMSDRHVYIANIGLFIIVSVGVSDLLKRPALLKVKQLLPYLSLLILALFSIMTFKQVQRWKDSLTLFSYAVKVSPQSFQAYNNYGAELIALGRYKEALEVTQKGLRVNPNSKELYYNMGDALTRLGRIDEAYDYFKLSSPNLSISKDFYYKREGLKYLKEKKYMQAVHFFSLSLRLKDNDIECINNLGIALMGLEKFEDAVEMFTRGLTINPKNYQLLHNRGLSLKKAGRPIPNSSQKDK